MQFDFFSQTETGRTSNQLKGLRISKVGKFRMKAKDLNEKLCEAGVQVSQNDKKPLTSIIMETNLLVFGSNPTEDELKRIALNEHHGFYPQRITEDELYAILDGDSTIELKSNIEKRLNITYDYYIWQPPIIKEKEFYKLNSSPVAYDFDSFTNLISQKEIYVPDFSGVNMDAFRQIIGNLGGYANREYYDDTSIVMLSDSTLEKLKLGEKDEVILKLEKSYNESNSKTFNVQFTCESDFLAWVKARQSRYYDSTIQRLLDILQK